MNEARKWEMEVQARLRDIPPATIAEEDWEEDPLTAQELLAAYNASLKRCQSVELGTRIEATIECSVFIDEWENKHVVTQPLGAKGSRVSELMMSIEGTVLRLSLERFGGEVLNLDRFMGIGLTEMPDEELKTVPGYFLQLTRYRRQGEHLLAVEQVRRYYDSSRGHVISDQECTLS